MQLTFKIRRTDKVNRQSSWVEFCCNDLQPQMTLFEALDRINEKLTAGNEKPIAFDSDCRVGLCGKCGFLVNGQPHGPTNAIALCQLRLWSFNDGDVIELEPWNHPLFPVVEDLRIDKSVITRLISLRDNLSSVAC